MKDSGGGISVSILGKDFMVACPESEREALRAAAAYLDRAMREISASGKVIGSERSAVMAALNITNELLTLRARGGMSSSDRDRVRQLVARIDAALAPDAPVRQ
jgi:cell division protein ZapA